MASSRLTQVCLATAAVALLASAIPTVNKYISHENCIETTSAPTVNFLSTPLNQALCSFNVTFEAAYSTPAGRLLVNAFGSFFACAAFILIYYKGAIGALVLFVGQIVPICITYPAYQAIASRPTSKRTASQAWVALLSVCLGYLLPSSSAVTSNLDYIALSVWQVYPVAILALTIVLQPIGALLSVFGRRVPILLIAASGLWVSRWGYVPVVNALLHGRMPLDHLFYPSVTNFATAALWVFIVDFVIVMLSAVHATVAPHGQSTFLWLAVSLGFGPGAGLMAFWVYKELKK